MKNYSPKIPTKEVMDYFKTQTRVAKELQISTSTVNEWGEFVNEINSYRLIHLYPHLFDKFLPATCRKCRDLVGKHRQKGVA